METYIKGSYKKSIYKNETGYIIGLFKVVETNDEELDIYVNRTITFTGYFADLNEIDTYIFYGNLVNHERYGEQFNVLKYEKALPEEKDAIVSFLSSELFPGIGEAKAKKIVKALGKDTLHIILENPENLILIPGVTRKNIDILHTKLMDYQSSYQTILFLSELGFNPRISMAIINKYHDETIPIVKNNIYRLYEDFYDITFKSIDYIALKNKIDVLDERRIKAGILYVMDEICNTIGHSYLLLDEISLYLNRCFNLNVPRDKFESCINSLLIDVKLIQVDEKYYLKNMYEAEVNIVNRFSYLSHKEPVTIKKIDRYMQDLESYYNITYNDEQLTAIKDALINDLLIITGGPGTGKTTIIKGITELYRLINKLSHEELQKEIALLAPTGRASKRLSESTLLSASTIHRFLKWNKELNKFAVNEHNKSDVKLVIIDEVSMIDTYLLDSLLKGLKYDTKIILVGDYNQLPSVGPGQVLKDLIESNSLNVKYLTKLYRQSSDSNIITLAYDINNNHFDPSIFNQGTDLEFIEANNDNLQTKLLEVAKKYTDVDYKDIQILAPMYKGINGIDLLNKNLAIIFNPKASPGITINDMLYREHDKVIQLTNMPDDNVFNGDIGIISKIVTGNHKEVYIDFDGNEVRYTASNFQKFKQGFAISIHKSQGSEFDYVIIPVVKSYGKMLYRKLIYTAVTRAKKKLIIIGDQEAFKLAIKNDNTIIRRTGVKEMLINGIK